MVDGTSSTFLEHGSIEAQGPLSSPIILRKIAALAWSADIAWSLRAGRNWAVADGRAKLETEEFDLLISDLGLPDKTSHDLMRFASEIKPNLVGFAVSGYGMDSDREKSREAGFLDHLTKPVDMQVLRLAVARIAPRRSST